MKRTAVAVALLTLSPLYLHPAFAAAGESGLAAQQRAAQAYSRLPLSFTRNAGQADRGIAFLAQGSGYSVILSRTKAQMTLSQWTETRHSALDHSAPAPPRQDVLQLTFNGANAPAAVEGVDEQQAKTNYLIGSDPKRWHTDVPNFAQVRYSKIYPGVDLVYYGNQREMEFDLVLKPQADATAVRFQIAGTIAGKPVSLTLNTNGDLVRKAGGGDEILLRKPVVYQTAANGQRQPIEGSFALAGKNEVRFHLGNYDKSRELVIDPTLAYATYLGSKNTESIMQAVAADALGNAYVGGVTYLLSGTYDFPVTPGAFQTTVVPPGTGFITKFKADGSGLIYSTFLGGISTNGFGGGVQSLAVDGNGSVYAVGQAIDSDFPVTNGAFQTNFYGTAPPFVTKLNPQGSGLVYSTFLSGTANNVAATKVLVDATGAAYVLGETNHSGFPVTAGAYQPNPGPDFTNGAYDATLTKLSPDGSSLIYSTYFGGYSAGTTTNGTGLALDGNGSAYIAGTVQKATGFPVTPGAFSNVGRGFAVKFNPGGSALVYATLLKGQQSPAAIAVDPAGSLYITGEAGQANLPVTPGAYQTTCDVSDQQYGYACFYAFVQKLNPAGTGQVYTTYLGTGPAYGANPGAITEATDIAVNTQGEAYIVGLTSSKNWPVTPDALFKDPDDPNDPDFSNDRQYLTKFNAAGSALLYSTYLGAGTNLALDTLGHVYVAGVVLGESPFLEPVINIFKATPNAFQTTFVSSSSIDFSPSEEGALIKLAFGQSFCNFRPTLLLLDQNGGKAEGFGLIASFAAGSSPLNPASLPLSLVIGGYTFVVPPASFHKTITGYTYQGTLNGVRLTISLLALPSGQGCSANQYDLYATGSGGTFHNALNPVPVAVSVGENGVSAAVTAQILH